MMMNQGEGHNTKHPHDRSLEVIDLSGVSAENKQVVAAVLREIADALELASTGDRLEFERFWRDPRHDEHDDAGDA